MADSSLILKYRPKTFEEVIGHGNVGKRIAAALKDKIAHSFLLVGPGGTGKTTLARIIASTVGCQKPLEIDAATFTGIDSVKEIQKSLSYKSFNGEYKVLIMDECHRLSSAAWTSLLKSVEEPGPNVIWVFCTTELAKVPATIQTRCQLYDLKPVDADDLTTLLEKVRDAEGWTTPEDVLSAVAVGAQGSPRRALSLLGVVYRCKDGKAARKAIATAHEPKDAADICRLLLDGKPKWSQVVDLIKKVEEKEAESLRIGIVNYLAGVLSNTKDDKRAMGVLAILSEFAEPYRPFEKNAPLYLSIGRALYAGE